jgi:hypothetical protein
MILCLQLMQAKYHNFRKVLMGSEIGLNNIALLSFGIFKMVQKLPADYDKLTQYQSLIINTIKS